MIGCVENVKLEAISTTVSKNRVPVEERCVSLISAKQAKRLIKGTGFEKLSIVPDGICTSDLCFNSAEQLFEKFGYDRSSIGACIFLTQTADYLSPATAYYLQERLGLPKDITAFDVNLGCSGFVYGIYLASMILNLNPDRKVLFLCGDTASRNAYPNDTSMLPIAGDAGTAAVFGKCSDGRKIFYNINSDGSKADCLIVERGGYRKYKITDEFGNLKPIAENYASMDGMAVMDFSLKDTPDNINALLDYAKIKPADLDTAFFHQANKIIVESLADKLKIDRSKVPFNSGEIGNTSSASIPVCMTELKKTADFKNYHTTLLSGFGVGMSIASMIMDLNDVNVLETLEI